MNDIYTNTPEDASRPASVLNVLAGIWLIISPWVLGFGDMTMQAAFWSTLLSGIAVLVLAAIRLATTGTQALSWLNLLAGVWLIISPFVLAFSAAQMAMGNAIFLGILVAIFSLWAALGAQTTTTTVTRPR
jgi:hypothetical protein